MLESQIVIEKYFRGYPNAIKQQVTQLLNHGDLKFYLQRRYPHQHNINSDKLLYQYTTKLKLKYMQNAPPLSKAIYEKKKDLIQNALGTHSFISRNHGGKLKRKHEIRISTELKYAPKEMLKMLVVHELAHFKEKEHNKAFYKLCTYMQEQYHQVEFDMRLYLILIEQGHSLY